MPVRFHVVTLAPCTGRPLRSRRGHQPGTYAVLGSDLGPSTARRLVVYSHGRRRRAHTDLPECRSGGETNERSYKTARLTRCETPVPAPFDFLRCFFLSSPSFTACGERMVPQVRQLDVQHNVELPAACIGTRSRTNQHTRLTLRRPASPCARFDGCPPSRSLALPLSLRLPTGAGSSGAAPAFTGLVPSTRS